MATTTVAKTMTGKVTDLLGRYFVVETDGPAHLQQLNLEPRVMRGASIGDTVRLTYASTSSWGQWYVSEVL